MEPIAFTPAGPGDSAALFDLFCRVRAHDLGAASWDEAVRAPIMRMQFEAQTRGYHERWPSAETFFLSGGGGVAGWTIVDRGESAIRVVEIAIVPEARGRGLGTSALRTLQEDAARSGRSLTLSVARSNIPAIRLYARLGFEAAGADELHLHLEWRPPFALRATGDGPAAAPAPVLTSDLFRSALGTWFEVAQPGPPLLLPLREVNEHAPAGGFVRFSLLFHGPGDRLLPQGLYTLRHPLVGDHDLFLVPVIGSTSERILYECCFSTPDPRQAT
jgi:GNAT superfamily N-acetyltransferase